MDRHFRLYGDKIYIVDEWNNILDTYDGTLTPTIVESIIREKLQSTPPRDQPSVLTKVFMILFYTSGTIRKKDKGGENI